MSAAPHPALEDFVVDIDGRQKLSVRIAGRRHTVELREPLPFEDDIIGDVTAPGRNTGVRGAAIPMKGRWISGWILSQDNADYINNIFRNWLFFIRYLEGRTARIENIDTFQRAPGTYDSMYRYILVLEDLGLIERFRSEEVPATEYDFPVPEEFRNRTFVRVNVPYREAMDDWDNPIEARYPGGELPEEEVEVEVEPAEVIEPEPEPEEPTTPAEIEIEPTEEEEPEEEEFEGLEAFTEPEEEPEEEEVEETELEVPEEEVSIDDFPLLDELEDVLEDTFILGVQQAFEESPLPTEDISPEDFGIARIGVFSSWAQGDAIAGMTPLEMVISIDATQAARQPGFVTGGTQNTMEDILDEDNPFMEWFPSYNITVVYNAVFRNTIDDAVRNTQTELRFYDLQNREFVSVS